MFLDLKEIVEIIKKVIFILEAYLEWVEDSLDTGRKTQDQVHR